VSFVVCLGGEIVSTFDMPDSVKLGRCDLIEEIMIGEDRLLKFSGLSYIVCHELTVGHFMCVCVWNDTLSVVTVFSIYLWSACVSHEPPIMRQ